MDEPNVDETNPEPNPNQRRWEGMIRVSKSRGDAGNSPARAAQQLVAGPAPGPATTAPPRVPSAAEVRAGGRRWQPEPADWTSTVFGIELPHDLDCPLYAEEEPDEPQYAVDEVDELPAVPVTEPVPVEQAPDAPAEARTAPGIVVDPTLALPPADPRHAQLEAPGFEAPWFDPPEVLDPEDDEVVGSVVLIPVVESEPVEPAAVVAAAAEPVELEADEHPVIDEADLDLVAVELQVLAQGLSNAIDERYTELPVVVPPRSERQPPAQARVPGSRRESDPVAPSVGIGATLAAARCSAGLTHDQLARITRIGVARLVEFENDDYSGCGADIFARGRLDSIARAVGVDPEPLLQEFDARYGGRHTWTYTADRRPQIRMPRNWTLVLLCALAVAGIYPVALLVVAVLG